MKILTQGWLRASIIIAIVACVFVTLNAMKQTSPVFEANLATWYFIGDSETDPLDPANYQRTPVAPCGTGEEVICEILAPENPAQPSQPDFNEDIKINIETAIKGQKMTNETVKFFRAE